MISTFDLLEKKHRKTFLSIFGFLTILIFLGMRFIDTPLKDKVKGGIVAFELAKDYSNSQEILTAWSNSGKIYAGFSLGFDFIFIFAYSLFFSLAIFHISIRFLKTKKWIYQLGMILIWLIFLAGFLDIFENIALFKLLTGSTNEFLSQIAFYCASAKFLFIGIGVLFIGGAYFFKLLRHLFKPLST